ncbi:MAG TPA: glycine cleavage system aminomethyltransferase GcvT [Bacteriovoracaceae bacterium]|nr:glycine cleavage system aminomethyltransferase GcvT [Bacteriovoracaceae bacterium]
MSNFKTHLYDEHLKLNAKIVPFAGWDMPVQYTSVKEEVSAVRNSVGVFDVSHMGEFFVTGPDALKFVDYILTNDISAAEVGKAIYSPLCRENGTVIDDLIVYKFSNERLLICVNASNIEKDFTWIKSKLGGFNCELVNKSDDYSLLAVQGPKTYETLVKVFPDLENISYYSVIEKGSFIFARTGYTGEDGFEVFGSHQEIIELWGKLIALGVTPCGLASRDVLRLEVCFPLYGHELDDNVTPYDATLGWTVKHTKENFIGKDALTNKPTKYKLVKLLLDKGIPRDGYPVVNAQGENIGVVTSGTMSVTLNKGIALARIDVDKVPADDVFLIDIRNKHYPAQLVKKSFVTGGHK